MTTRTVLALSLTALLLAGGAVFARSGSAAPSAATSAVGVAETRFGRILVDGRGFALYAFTRDTRNRSACYGDCARAWPPFLVARRPAAVRGVRAGLLGAARRSAGRLQATYAGRPLYYYRGDTRPGLVLCQDVDEYGGTWLVLRGSGQLVR